MILLLLKWANIPKFQCLEAILYDHLFPIKSGRGRLLAKKKLTSYVGDKAETLQRL